MLDSKLTKLKQHFGIAKPEDWQAVDPNWILGIDGIGPVTLDYLRVLLANRGLALRNDRTPEHWKKHLAHVQIINELGDSELADEGQPTDTAAICPFTIFIDSAEQQPFTFAGMTTDADQGYRPLIVNTEWRPLGRGDTSLGDYTIDGYLGRIGQERKSVDDLISTILGWGGRRERFERELQNLNEIDCAAVVVEGSLQAVLAAAPEWGKKTADENRKILFRSIVSYQMKWPRVIWAFCDSRWLAEKWCFQLFRRYWEGKQEEKREELRAAGVAAKHYEQISPIVDEIFGSGSAPVDSVSITDAAAMESNLLF